MAYTDEQKKILALCQKYRGVRVQFFNSTAKQFHIIIDGKFSLLDNMEIGYIENWLNAHAFLKQVGRPKGWRKDNPKKTAKVTLTPEQWQVIERIQAENGFKYHSQAIAMCIDFYNNQNN